VSKRHTILLVEDNLDDEALTLRALEKSELAYEVVVARDGAEALNLIFGDEDSGPENEIFVPSVIFLDLKLPKIGGLEILKRIRNDKRFDSVPVAVFSSSLEKQDITDSYQLGANSFIHKPVNFVEFGETVRNLGLYWLELNQIPRMEDGF
jgi:CheY-like chemotaxis protein